MNLDAYFGGSEMQAMARIIYIAQALAETSAAAGSSFGLQATAAAANVTNALGMLLQRKLTLPCTSTASQPGALCYDPVFKVVTTARALAVSMSSFWNLRACGHWLSLQAAFCKCSSSQRPARRMLIVKK